MKMIILIVLALVLLVGGYFAYLSFSAPSAMNSKGTQLAVGDNGANSQTVDSQNSSGTARVIDIKASRFQYEPSTITVKKGERVKLVIDNSDFAHGIFIPDLNVKGIDSVEFTADKVGTFTFRCPTFCGEGHKSMTGTLIVEE